MSKTVLTLAVFVTETLCSAGYAAPPPSTSSNAVPAVQSSPPPPASVSPNASLVTATVLKYSVWSPQATPDRPPPSQSVQTVYSILVEVHTAAPVLGSGNEIESLAKPGMVREMFSPEPLSSDLVGKQIQAIVSLRGDTARVWWWITDISAQGP